MPISNLHKSILELLQYISEELFINVTASVKEVSICSYQNTVSQFRFVAEFKYTKNRTPIISLHLLELQWECLQCWSVYYRGYETYSDYFSQFSI